MQLELRRSAWLLVPVALLFVFGSTAIAQTDLDGDGWTVEAGDCDDGNEDIHPGAQEICGDGINQSCGIGPRGGILPDKGCDDDNDDYCDASMPISASLDCDPSVRHCCPLGGGDCLDDDRGIGSRFNPGVEDNCSSHSADVATPWGDLNCDGVSVCEVPDYEYRPELQAPAPATLRIWLSADSHFRSDDPSRFDYHEEVITSMEGRYDHAFVLGDVVDSRDDGYAYQSLKALMKQKQVVFALDLGRGRAAVEWLGCDLSRQYVTLNADYTT